MIKFLRKKKEYKTLSNSEFFDVDYYLRKYTDIRGKDIDPIKHYINFGAKEGRNPSNYFNTNYYLSTNKDVDESYINPLYHYIKYGIREGRLPNSNTLKEIYNPGDHNNNEVDKIRHFFVVGAPRSGTTMLRDLFKQINTLYAPEETHFFRWAAPFRTNEYDNIYNNNKILKYHRELDEISDLDFKYIYNKATTKREMTDLYCSKVTEIKGKKYWFDKTPQNVYGLPLIAEQYEDCKIIHIVRHPYDVIKSLLVGKVIKTDDIIGAANYWYESVAIVNILKPYLKDRLIEVNYNELVINPQVEMNKIGKLVGIEYKYNTSKIKGKQPNYSTYYTKEEFRTIHSICGKYMKVYHYDFNQEAI